MADIYEGDYGGIGDGENVYSPLLPWDSWAGFGGDFGGQTNVGGTGMVPEYFDTQTGQWVTLQQILSDPEMSAAFQQDQSQANFGGLPSGAMPSDAASWNANYVGKQDPATQKSLGGWWGGLQPGQKLGLGITGATSLAGLAGVIAKAMAGDTESKQTLQRTLATSTPEERDAIARAIAGMSQMQQNQQELLAKMGPGLLAGAQGAMGQQDELLAALLPTAKALASGGLPANFPTLLSTMGSAAAPQAGRLAEQAIEGARRRGFAGGAELLQQGPGSALLAPALAELQGTVLANALNYSLQGPQLAAQMSQAFQDPAAQRLNAYSNLQGLNTNLLASLGTMGNQLTQNRINAPIKTTQTNQQPFSWLEAIAPLGDLTSRFGGALTGVDAANSPYGNRGGYNPTYAYTNPLSGVKG